MCVKNHSFIFSLIPCCPLSFKTERIKHEEEENFYKPVRVSNFWSNGYIEYESNGVMVIEIKHYQLKNILIKLDHIISNNVKKI